MNDLQVSPHILLPDTICTTCLDNVENFFDFIKNCLQNIIILEQQYDVHESCLKTKRRFEKSCSVSLGPSTEDKNIQTEYLEILRLDWNEGVKQEETRREGLVDYELSDQSDGEEDGGKVELTSKKLVMNDINLYIDQLLTQKTDIKKHYFDDVENNLISEITQRKDLKRKGDVIETRPTKIFKMDTSNRRKNKQPKKLDYKSVPLTNGLLLNDVLTEPEEVQPKVEQLQNNTDFNKDLTLYLPQICLLCESSFSGAAALATHVYETHGIDMAEVVGQQPNGVPECAVQPQETEKKKKIPNLVKISDLKKEATDDNEQPPILMPSFVCPMCPAVFTAKSELFVHLRVKHPDSVALMCGMCMQQTSTSLNLRSHVETCAQSHHFNSQYTCQLCFYADDDLELVENHVPVHHFLVEMCAKQNVKFEPLQYVKQGPGRPNMLFCELCRTDDFRGFKEFSTHRRLAHSIFHCDLCTKLYGRNSHLWKHVNRLHKGHSRITCQLCFKTSASEYHLQQHFNKIHGPKVIKTTPGKEQLMVGDHEDFMTQKFQGFDFQSVKQSFMKQELLKQQKPTLKTPVLDRSNSDTNSNSHCSDRDEGNEVADAPKAIDSTSDLYTNIITNYTPPVNVGDHKCPKCGKNFQKKPMLKKHKKNCRPRLQKDLLTRCKSCARVFKDRQSLTKHLDNYHSDYACEICNVKVQSKCEIVSHIRFSHPQCHLVCKHCDNILRSREDMSQHLANHNESFICQFCADSIPSKIKLKMHVLSLHRKILSLSCGVCLKLFETQHILRDHVRLVHKDQLSPLTSCTVCGKNYGSKWKTFDHLNKSHGKIFKACRICLEVFNGDDELQTHTETAHLNNSFKLNKKTEKAHEADEREEKKDNDHTEYDNETDDEEEGEEYDSNEECGDDNGEESKYALAQELKMSLLEKRLTGKKLTEEEAKPISPSKRQKNTRTRRDRDKSEDDVVANPQHTSSKRTVYVNSNDPSYCEICFKNWPAKKHLWQHYIRCHKTEAATVCGICLKTNDSYEALQRHLQETHPTLLHGQGYGSNFICRICGRYHNASSKLRLHMAIHENFDWSILSSKEDDKLDNKDSKDEVNGYGTT